MKRVTQKSVFNAVKGLLFLLILLCSQAFAQVELVATGSGGAYVISNYPGNWSAKAGVTITFKANHTNPGGATTTLTVGGVARNIYKQVNTSLSAGDIISGQEVMVTFDGTNFQMMSNLGNSGGSMGTGTANYLSRWVTSSTLGTSSIQDNGTSAAINGTPFAGSRLYINNTGSSTGIELENKSSSRGLYLINDGSATGYGFSLRNNANTVGFELEHLNSTSTANAFYLQNSSAGVGLNIDVYGTGLAATFTNQNTTNNSTVMIARSYGTGGAGVFTINNASSSGHALESYTDGSGVANRVTNAGTGTGSAVYVTNTSNSSSASYIYNNGVGSALELNNSNSSNSSVAFNLNNSGTGAGLAISLNNSISSADALYAGTSGTGLAGNFAGKVRVTNFQMTNGAGAGLVLTSDAAGNATWQSPGASAAWGLTGNAGINAATNFLGTTDNSAVVFRTNNTEAMRLTINQNLLLGTATNDGRLTIQGSNSGSGTNAISAKNSLGEGLFFVRNNNTSGFGFGPSDASTAATVTIKGTTSDTSSRGLHVVDGAFNPVLTTRGDGKVGIGAYSPTHKLTINGFNGSWDNGPHMAFYTGDPYPSFSTLIWNHSEQWLMFNTDYNGTFISSDPSSNFAIHTELYGNNALKFDYASGVSAGNMVSFNTGIALRDNGNVGIGTSTPNEKLDVDGGIWFTGALRPNGVGGNSGEVLTSNGPGLAPTWSTVNGLSGGSVNYIPKWTSSTSLSPTSLLYDNGSSVGVKTTLPQSTMHVHETGGLLQLRLTNANTGGTSSDGFAMGGSSNDVFLLNYEAGDMSFLTNGLYRMTIDMNGNVGIGSTTAPITKLDVEGDFSTRESVINTTITAINNFAIGAYSFVTITGETANFSISGIASGVNGKQLKIYNNTNFTMTLLNLSLSSVTANQIITGTGADIILPANGTVELVYSTNKMKWIVTGWNYTPGSASPFTKSGSNVYLSTLSDNVSLGSTSATNKLDVEGSLSVGTGYSGSFAAPSNGAIIEGAVGIGTTSPYTNAKLDVVGSNGSADGTNGVFMDLQNSSNATNNLTGIRFTGSSMSSYKKTAILVPYTNGSWGVSDMMFALNGVNDATPVTTANARMTIKGNSGFVGIGTSAPSQMLDVQGKVYAVSGGRFGGSAGTSAGMLEVVNTGGWSRIFHASDASSVIKFVVESNGDVGIGQSSPLYRLHTASDVVGATVVLSENTYNGTSHGEGLWGISVNNPGFGYGVRAEGGYMGARGIATASTYSGTAYGLYGSSSGTSGVGARYGVYGTGSGGATNYGGYFSGNLHATGTLSKGAGTFKIDHPLDPDNKYLIHSFVESPDMMNIYNGNVVTDASGVAEVSMPAYFDALNKDFRYQLTVIGTFAQAIIDRELDGNKFYIKTDKPNVKVSWQVTGVRKDGYANQNRIVPEVEKPADEKGLYLHPEAIGKPKEKGIDYQREKAVQEQDRQKEVQYKQHLERKKAEQAKLKSSETPTEKQQPSTNDNTR